MTISRAFGRFFLSLFLVFSVVSPGFSQPGTSPTPSPTPTGPIQMALSSPFAQTTKPLVLAVRPRRWFPVGVTLSNTGEEVEGEVRLRLLARGGFQTPPNEFITRVTLPANSRKLVWLYGRMERAETTGIQVSFSGRGFRALNLGADLAETDSDRRLVIDITDQNDGMQSILTSLRGQALFRGSNGGRINTGISPVLGIQTPRDNVPDRWIGFDAADLLILGDFPHAALSPLQIESIRGFAQGGGTVLAPGGSGAARFGASPLRDLWPLTPQNTRSASASEVAGLVRRYVPNPQNGADRLGGAPVVLTNGALKADAILRDGTRQNPLFSIQNTGAGRCVFLSYNPAEPPFVGWSGQGNLWREIFAASARPERLESVDADYAVASGVAANPAAMGSYYDGSGPSTATGRLLSALSKAPQLKLPPVSDIAWFLALYVFFLVPLNYAILRFFDRRELAWLTIPVIVATFSVLAYSQALRIRGRAILTRQVEIVQTSFGSNRGRSDSMLWLFSPRTTTYQIKSEGLNAAVADYVNDAGVGQGTVDISQPDEGRSFEIENAPVRIWTDRAFTSQALADLGTGFSLSGQGLRNGTGLDLEGAVWVQDRRVWSIGKIAKGQSATKRGSGEKISGANLAGAVTRAANLEKVFDTATIANGIPSQTLSAALGGDFGKLNSDAMLVAWAKKPLSPMPIGGANGRDLMLVIVRAGVLPPQFAAREATVSRAAFEPFSSNNGLGGGYAFYDCQLPKNGTFTLSARGLNRGYAYGETVSGKQQRVPSFEIWNPRQNRWQSLGGQQKRDKTPVGGWDFKTQVSSDFARQPDLILRVRARLENQGQSISSLSIE